MGMPVGNTSNLTNEPNVVPMIDIMLVLLIIFMVMQPRLRKSIDLQLPDPTPRPASTQSVSDQIVLEVGPNEYFAINKEVVPADRLLARLTEIYAPRPDKIIFVKGDPTVTYQEVIRAMDIARGAGVTVIGVPPKDDEGAAAGD
ncbi:MAG: ExbD/TolR family protein [Gemmatimonadaceae bacterium]